MISFANVGKKKYRKLPYITHISALSENPNKEKFLWSLTVHYF